MLGSVGNAFANSVTSASSFQFSLFVALGVTLALGSGWMAYAMLVRKRVLQDTPTALIRSASQGYVELQGHAELMDGDQIVAPLSMRTCVWYRYKVEEKSRSYSGSGSRSNWRTIERDISDSLFYLVDATGRCAVDPDGANVTRSSRDVWYGKSRFPGRVERDPGWLRFIGIAQIGRNYRYTEERIEPGDPLYVLGDFTTHRGSGSAFDRGDDVRELLGKWKHDKIALLDRFDTNNDGDIDMDEWDAARAAAEMEVDNQRTELAVAPPVDVVGHAAGSRNPFIIAAKTEAEMLSHFHWRAVGLWVLTLISSCTVFWMLTIR